MNIYESITILNASLTDEELEAATVRIKDLITNSGGEILKADIWGRKRLAYEIKKHKKGYYILLIFKAAPSLIKKLEDLYKVFDPVIRYMVIKLDKRQAANIAAVPDAAARPGDALTTPTPALQ